MIKLILACCVFYCFQAISAETDHFICEFTITNRVTSEVIIEERQLSSARKNSNISPNGNLFTPGFAVTMGHAQERIVFQGTKESEEIVLVYQTIKSGLATNLNDVTDVRQNIGNILEFEVRVGKYDGYLCMGFHEDWYKFSEDISTWTPAIVINGVPGFSSELGMRRTSCSRRDKNTGALISGYYVQSICRFTGTTF